MTDEIRITRRVALIKDYEFYELEIKVQMDWADAVADGINEIIDTFENKVGHIRNSIGEPSPEISPKRQSEPTKRDYEEYKKTKNDEPYSDLLIYEGNTIKVKHYLKSKDKWGEINTYLKGLGYSWIGAGKDSRWER